MAKRKTVFALLGLSAGIAAARLADLALVGGTLATAVAAVGFAGYMTLAGTHEPLINGMEHLAIFAQPSHHAGVSPRLDMAPVGAVPREARQATGGYALVGAQPQFAWLREGNRIFAARPGDEVPRLGRIAAIAQRDGRWVLLDDQGATLIAGSLAELSPGEGGRFGKRLIFGPSSP